MKNINHDKTNAFELSVENAGKRATDKIEKRKRKIGRKTEGEKVAIPRRI